MTCPQLLLPGLLGLGPGEIILILAGILLIFGAKKLPEIMGSFGKGIKEFKKEVDGAGGEIGAGKPEAGEENAPGKPAAAKDRPGEKPPDGEGS